VSTEGSGAGATTDPPKRPRRTPTAAPPARPAGTAGELYANFIKAELDAEAERRTHLDERGARVVTTASVLATVVFAVGALVARVDGDSPDGVTATALLVGLGLFAAAALCGLLTTLPGHDVTHQDVYYDMIRNRWDDTEDAARRSVAFRNEITLKSLRSANRRKAAWLLPAFCAQVAAAVALLVAVGNALFGA
jgi:hypothetical protein